MDEAHADRLERTIGVRFDDRELLAQVFVHRSFLNEQPNFLLPSNERLEFLGDAVLGLTAAELLFRQLPAAPEGELTRLRAVLVRGPTLAHFATGLNLGDYLRLGRGEAASGGQRRQTILAGAFEALVGAVYLDRGRDVAREFIVGLLRPVLERVLAEDVSKDYKSRLQELVQAQLKLTPAYRVVSEEGPEHCKIFSVTAQVGDRVLGWGRGQSKQEAQQEAAREALEHWNSR